MITIIPLSLSSAKACLVSRGDWRERERGKCLAWKFTWWVQGMAFHGHVSSADSLTRLNSIQRAWISIKRSCKIERTDTEYNNHAFKNKLCHPKFPLCVPHSFCPELLLLHWRSRGDTQRASLCRNWSCLQPKNLHLATGMQKEKKAIHALVSAYKSDSKRQS